MLLFKYYYYGICFLLLYQEHPRFEKKIENSENARPPARARFIHLLFSLLLANIRQERASRHSPIRKRQVKSEEREEHKEWL